MSRKPTFDARCFLLAEHFLAEGAPVALKAALAQEIQLSIESFLEDHAAAVAASEGARHAGH